MVFDTDLLLGILAIGLGGLLWLAVRIAMRQAIPKIAKEIPEVKIPNDKYPVFQPHAVLIIERGGKIKSLNQLGLDLFGLKKDQVNDIDTLAQMTRPPDVLFELCGTPTEKQIRINGLLVDASSYAIDEGMLVSFRKPVPTDLNKPQLSDSTTLELFSKFTQTIATNLNLDESLEIIFKSLPELVPNDFVEIAIWDTEEEVLVPYRYLYGKSENVEKGDERYLIGEGFSGEMIQTHQSIWIEDIASYQHIPKDLIDNKFSLASFMGFPLILGHEVIGTLGIGSSKSYAFQKEDRELIKYLSGQIATVIRNALLFQLERKRAAELSSLAQLSQSFSVTHDPEIVFERMLSIIGTMVPVEILGFLLFNHDTYILEAQKPFKGLPDQFVEIFKSEITIGSEAEKLIKAQDVLITDSAIEDTHWRNLGLTHVARAASMRKTVLVPLLSGGVSFGYLLASNHNQGNIGFSQVEMHLLMIVANQAAPLIENIYIISQSNKRAQRAEVLQRIALNASSTAEFDQVISYSVEELSKMLNAEFGAIFLLNSDRTQLVLHRDSIYGLEIDNLPEPNRLMVDDSQYQLTMTNLRKTLVIGQFNETKPVAPFYQELLDTWKLQSAIIVPLLLRDEGIGEIWIGSSQLSYFDQGDVQEILPIASQLAGIVEQSNLINQTDEGLRKQVDQLSVFSRINRDLSASLDLDQLLEIVYDQALKITNAVAGTILLFNNEDNSKINPEVLYSIGVEHSGILTSDEIQLLQTGNSKVISGEESDSEWNLPAHYRSALIIPVFVQQKPGGLIYLYGEEINNFNEKSLEDAQSLAAQSSKAFEKAFQFEAQGRTQLKLEKELETQKRLFLISEVLRPGQPFNVALDAIAMAILEVTPFKAVLISIYDQSIKAMRRYTGKGFDPEMWEELQFRTQPWSALSELLNPQFKYKNVYFIPQENAPEFSEDLHHVSTFTETEDLLENKWHRDDICMVPLFDSIGEPLGLVSVDNPDNGLRPDHQTLDVLEMFSFQIGLLIENNKHSTEIRQRMASLTEVNTKLREALDASQSNVPGLIQKHLEQKEVNQRISNELKSLKSVFDLTVLASRQPNAISLVSTIGEKLTGQYGMQYGLVVEKKENEFLQLQKVIGVPPEEINLDALLGQTNPIYFVLQNNNKLIVSLIEEDGEWSNSPLLNAFKTKSFIALPFKLSKNHNLVLLMVANQPIEQFVEPDEVLLEQLIEQANSFLQQQTQIENTNQHLEEVVQILDFSRRLGNLKFESIVENLLDSSLDFVTHAQAGWIALWNEQKSILEPKVAKGYFNGNQLLAINYQLEENSLPISVYLARQSKIVDQVDFAVHYPLNTEDLIHFREATGGRLPLANMVIPIFILDKSIGVMVLENYDEESVFVSDDERMINSLAQQAAFALEHAYLLRDSQKRSNQLQALTNVSGEITSSLQTRDLIDTLLVQLKHVIDYETATLWLVDKDKLKIVATNGFNDNEKRIGISTEIQDSPLFLELNSTKEIISVPDMRLDERFSLLTHPENLSWMGVPIISKSNLIGMIALEKSEPGFYKSDQIQIARTFASQAAVAMDNAGIFEESFKRTIELDERSKRLAFLNQFSSDVTVFMDVSHIIQLTLERISEALRCDKASLLMIDGKKIEFQGSHPMLETPFTMDLSSHPLLLRLQETKGVFYVPELTKEAILEDLHLNYFQKRETQSVLFVPLLVSANVTGWLILESNNLRRFLSEEIELAQTIANQSAISIQNARLLEELQNLTKDLESRVEERNEKMALEHNKTLTLLNITTQLSTSLDIEKVLSKTLTVLSDSLFASSGFIFLTENEKYIFVGEPTFTTNKKGEMSIESPERIIAEWVFNEKLSIIINDLQNDNRFFTSASEELGIRSVIATPLILDEKLLGAILLTHKQPDIFDNEQIDLIEAAAKQISVKFNNAGLYKLTLAQTENQGKLLREQQIEASRMRAILEAVADGVLVTDSNNHITLFNHAASKIIESININIEELNFDQLVKIFGESAAKWLETIQNWTKQAAGHIIDETFTDQIIMENNRVISINLAPVIWNKEFLGTVSVFRDVTLRVQGEQFKSDFVANVSHELRTPLTAIKGYADIILMGAAGKITDQQKKFLDIIHTHTERLNILVDDLLDVSSIETGRLKLELKPLDMIGMAERVLMNLRIRSDEDNKPLTLHLDAPEDLPFVEGDPNRVFQIIDNLVSNSYHFTSENGSIIIRLQEKEDNIQIDVKDTGLGIPDRIKDRIFERFYRGDDPRLAAPAGTGLGLAVSKTLIELHGGKIWFESSGVPGEGSIFSFTLPIYKR